MEITKIFNLLFRIDSLKKSSKARFDKQCGDLAPFLFLENVRFDDVTDLNSFVFDLYTLVMGSHLIFIVISSRKQHCFHVNVTLTHHVNLTRMAETWRRLIWTGVPPGDEDCCLLATRASLMISRVNSLTSRRCWNAISVRSRCSCERPAVGGNIVDHSIHANTLFWFSTTEHNC